jgi:hypothetical protein
MKKIVEHWCLYYFATFKYFEKKKFKGAKDIAQQLLITQIFLYFGLSIILPITLAFFNSSNVLKENKWIIALIVVVIILPILDVFVNKSNVIKNKMADLQNIENWELSEEKRKGKVWFFAHIIITICIGAFYSLIAYLLFLLK